jgi:hypothetical protein
MHKRISTASIHGIIGAGTEYTRHLSRVVVLCLQYFYPPFPPPPPIVPPPPPLLLDLCSAEKARRDTLLIFYAQCIFLRTTFDWQDIRKATVLITHSLASVSLL